MSRLPTPGSDNDSWGTLLNDYLQQALAADGTLVTSPTNSYTGTTNTNLANSSKPGLVQLAGDLTVPVTAPKVTGLQGVPVAATTPADGQVLTYKSAGSSWQPAAAFGGTQTPTAIWGDGINSSSVQVGSTTYLRIPYSGTIVEWDIVASASCTCSIDIWKGTGSTLPTVANSITASAKPGLSSAVTTSSTTLTGWTTAVSAGNLLAFTLSSLTGSPSSITLVLKIT